LHFTLAPTLFEPRPHHAVHDPLRAPRRPREADAGPGHGALPRGVVDDVARRAHLRVRVVP